MIERIKCPWLKELMKVRASEEKDPEYIKSPFGFKRMDTPEGYRFWDCVYNEIIENKTHAIRWLLTNRIITKGCLGYEFGDSGELSGLYKYSCGIGMKTEIWSKITDLSKTVHINNCDKGFYDDPKTVLEQVCLIHSELGELTEAFRTDNYCQLNQEDLKFPSDNFDLTDFVQDNIKDTFEDELADVLIRCLDLAGWRGIDIGNHIRLKLAYNKKRPYKHGKKC